MPAFFIISLWQYCCTVLLSPWRSHMLDLISILRVARTPDIDNSATQVLYLHLENVDFDTQIVVLHIDMNYTNIKVLFSYRKH
jgi:hypothetical protein